MKLGLKPLSQEEIQAQRQQLALELKQKEVEKRQKQISDKISAAIRAQQELEKLNELNFPQEEFNS